MLDLRMDLVRLVLEPSLGQLSLYLHPCWHHQKCLGPRRDLMTTVAVAPVSPGWDLQMSRVGPCHLSHLVAWDFVYPRELLPS